MFLFSSTGPTMVHTDTPATTTNSHLSSTTDRPTDPTPPSKSSDLENKILAFIVAILGVLVFVLCYGLFYALLYIGHQRQNAAIAAALEMQPLLTDDNNNNNDNAQIAESAV